MFNLLPVQKIIVWIAVAYAALVIFLITLGKLFFEISYLSISKIAFTGAIFLESLLVVFMYFGWTWLWKKFPSLNRHLFPNLNGTWKMQIHWTSTKEHGVVDATAHIKQNFLNLSMDVESPKSDSETLLAKPKKEESSGRPLLYYIYRNTPKGINGNKGSPYEGAAILKLDHEKVGCLKGNYFTSAHTRGYFELNRMD